MSDPEGDYEWIKDRIAFEARFPLEAFEPIAQALGKSATPQNLKAILWVLRDVHLIPLSLNVKVSPSPSGQVERRG